MIECRTFRCANGTSMLAKCFASIGTTCAKSSLRRAHGTKRSRLYARHRHKRSNHDADASVQWTPERASSIATIQAHTACVYNAIFSPHEPDTLASCSSDGYLKVWDLKVPSSPTKPGRPQLSLAVHPTEVLSLDWNKYQPNMVATSSVDRSIKIHDLRMASSSPHPSDRATLATLLGHEYAVRKVAFSPHSPTLLASASYDMTARIWDVDVSGGAGPNGSGAAVIARKIYDLHSEFVVGLAWSLYEQGVVATSSWDQETHLWMC